MNDRTPSRADAASAAAQVRLDEARPAGRDETVFTLTLAHSALHRPRLSPFDRKLLDECNGPDATVADKLLGLELLVRRIEEAQRG